jgi:hypothetical protein
MIKQVIIKETHICIKILNKTSGQTKCLKVKNNDILLWAKLVADIYAPSILKLFSLLTFFS